MPESLLSPGSLLASFLSQPTQIGRLILLTGPSGSGKTAWCMDLIQQARQVGYHPSGLVSPAVIIDGIKVGIDLIEVATGARQRLANRRDQATPWPTLATKTPGWNFNPAVLTWGNNLLRAIHLSELLVIDELGPLEFLEGQGFTAGFNLIAKRSYRLACVVVRSALLPDAQERWPWSETLWFREVVR